MLKNFLRFAIAVSACLVALRVGYYLLGINFLYWDDEGYMLLSLKHYIAGGHLYSQVFTEYGPVFFWVESSLFRLFDQPVTHDAGRHITLLLWFVASLAAAWFLYRVSRSVLTASAAGLVMMLDAAGMVSEPNHPEHLALAVLLLACCASTIEDTIGFFLLGALGAALFFIKVNIGVFYFVALCGTLCCVLRSGLLRTIGGMILLLYFLIGPIALMYRDLHTRASGYCALAVLCGGLTFATALYTSPRFAGIRSTLSFAALGAILFSVLVMAGTMLQKTSLRSLLDGILLTPLHHPQLFQVPLKLSLLTTLCIALIVAGIIALYAFYRIRQREPTPNGMNLTAWVRFFRPDQQQEILGILQNDLNACVVWNPRIESFWNPLEFNATSPLASYIVNDMPRVSTIGDYQIRVNPQRSRPWIAGTP